MRLKGIVASFALLAELANFVFLFRHGVISFINPKNSNLNQFKAQ
jgi:hypothetical protein